MATWRLGLLNGLLIGLTLALGVWGPSLLALAPLPTEWLSASILVGAVGVIAVSGVAGWWAARWSSALGGGLLWLAAGLAMVWLIGHQPYEIENLVIGLADGRFRGQVIYSFTSAARARLAIAGFFILLVLVMLGFLQQIRLESLAPELEQHPLSAAGWLKLLLPLPIVLATGVVADSSVQRPVRHALPMVHEVIQTGRSYPGDLYQLSEERGINYNAIASLRQEGRLEGRYRLSVAQADLSATQPVIVTAYFDNGTWFNCRVMTDPTIRQVTYCYDASPPYLEGLAWLLAGNPPETCKGCVLHVDPQQRQWLADIGQLWEVPPVITRVAQKGTHVLMRAVAPQRHEAILCLFSGLSPIVVQRCWPDS